MPTIKSVELSIEEPDMPGAEAVEFPVTLPPEDGSGNPPVCGSDETAEASD